MPNPIIQTIKPVPAAQPAVGGIPYAMAEWVDVESVAQVANADPANVEWTTNRPDLMHMEPASDDPCSVFCWARAVSADQTPEMVGALLSSDDGGCEPK